MTRTTKLKYIKRTDIKLGDRFRKNYGDMDEFISSIREKGILQPVTLDQDLNLLAGGRRMEAALRLELDEIPALIRESDGEVDAREVELMENVFRKDFEWQEKCNLIAEIDRLYKAKDIDWSGRKTAQLLSKSKSDVAQALKLANACELIPELKECKTADDANRMLSKMEKQTTVYEARQKQKLATFSDGIEDTLKLADANYQIVNVFEEMKGLRDGGMIESIECDPPYSIDLASVKKDGNAASYEEVPTDAYPAFLARLCKELYRVAHKNCWLIFWFGPTHFTLVKGALQGAGWTVDDIPAIWVKPQGQTLNPSVVLGRAYEPFFVCRKGQPSLNKPGRLNTFVYGTVSSGAKYHPTQRPVDLMEDILDTFSATFGYVFVPFLGSGATLRAAYNLGMRCNGCDLNGEYKDKFMLEVEADARKLLGNGEEE